MSFAKSFASLSLAICCAAALQAQNPALAKKRFHLFDQAMIFYGKYILPTNNIHPLGNQAVAAPHVLFPRGDASIVYIYDTDAGGIYDTPQGKKAYPRAGILACLELHQGQLRRKWVVKLKQSPPKLTNADVAAPLMRYFSYRGLIFDKADAGYAAAKTFLNKAQAFTGYSIDAHGEMVYVWAVSKTGMEALPLTYVRRSTVDPPEGAKFVSDSELPLLADELKKK